MSKQPPLPTIQNGWALLPPEYNIQNFSIQNTLLLAENVGAGTNAYICYYRNDSNNFLVIRSLQAFAQRFVVSESFVGIEAEGMPPGALVGRVGWYLVIEDRPHGIQQIGKNVAKSGEQGYFNAPQAGTPDTFTGFQFNDRYTSHDDFGPIVIKPGNTFGVRVRTFDPDSAADFPPDGVQLGVSIQGYSVPITKVPYKNC